MLLGQRDRDAAIVAIALILGVSTREGRGHDEIPAEIELAPGGHAHDPGDPYGLHFSHPLITESPSPDTKARLDYFLQHLDDGDEQGFVHTVRLEAEYAFHPTLSLEVDVPFTFLDPEEGFSESAFDTVEIGLKGANFAFAEYGLLLGYGIELGLPTGDDAKGIGSDYELEIEPFLDAGFQCGRLELVAFARFGIPTNQNADEEVENELGFNASALFHVTRELMALVEFDGETALNGEESGATVANVTPGLKVRPFEQVGLEIGAGVSVPITGREEFEIQGVLAAFYHF